MRSLSFERLCARELMAGDLFVGAAGAGAAIGAAAAEAAREVANDGYAEGTTEGVDIKIDPKDIKISGDYKGPEFKFKISPEEASSMLEGIEVEYQSFDSKGQPIRPANTNNSNDDLDRYFRDSMNESMRNSTSTGGEKPIEVISEGYIQLPFVYIKR